MINSSSAKLPQEWILPKRVTIETIFGCNASCTMCPIDLPTDFRKKGVMSMDLFQKIIDDLEPYKDSFEKIDLFGLGEPLLDPLLFERIEYIRKKNMTQSLGLSTNANLLVPAKQKKLLDSGIDIVIFSIDGIKAETHESIRRNLKFDQVIENVLSTIKMRNEGHYKTRFLVRFIRQDSNKNEWPEYKQFWKSKLDFSKGDFMTVYNAHNWGGELGSKESVLNSAGIKESDEIEKMACHKPFNSLIVLADGTVPLCDEDFHHGKYRFGNAGETSLIEIFNSPKFKETRALHASGNKNQLEMCKQCTVHYSEPAREIVTANDDLI